MKDKQEEIKPFDQANELCDQEVVSSGIKSGASCSEENQRKIEEIEKIEEKEDSICRKRDLESKEDDSSENFEEKRLKKDKESCLLKVDQTLNHEVQPLSSSFKSFSDSFVSPFASLKSNNTILPLNSSHQSTKKTFGLNFSGPNFESLASLFKNDEKEVFSDSNENETNCSTDTYKKTNNTFGMLLEQEIDDNSYHEDNMSKKKAFVMEQEVKTGEEHEETIYSVRAKLYVMDSVTKDWKERGIGTLRVNIDQTEGVINRSRLVMRVDAVYKVILNASLFKEMVIEGGNIDTSNTCGFDKFLKIVALENGKPTQFAIKVKDNITAQQLREHILSAIPSNKKI